MARGREPVLRPYVRVLRAQDEIAVQVGRRIHDRRLSLRLTTHALQRRTGFPRYLIRYYEAGRVVATLHTLRRLAVALECEVVDFLGDREGKEAARDARRHESARIKG